MGLYIYEIISLDVGFFDNFNLEFTKQTISQQGSCQNNHGNLEMFFELLK